MKVKKTKAMAVSDMAGASVCVGEEQELRLQNGPYAMLRG